MGAIFRWLKRFVTDHPIVGVSVFRRKASILLWMDHSRKGLTPRQQFDNLTIMKIKEAVAALSALAQESRLEVFRLLVPLGEEGLAAGEIAEQLTITPATLTFHLKELCHAGLVESRREGRSILYALRPDGIRDLMEFLSEDCCQGQPHLCRPTMSDSCRKKKVKKRPKRATTK